MSNERAPAFLGNLSLYPNGIYGDVNQIDYLAQQSMIDNYQVPDYIVDLEENLDNDLVDLDNETLDEIFNDKKDQISGTINEELDSLERNNMPSSSLKQMETHIRRLLLFLESNNLNANIETVPIAILDDYLRFFYSSLKKQDGNYYTPASLICVRAALHRYFCINRPEVNIIADVRFSKSNRMLKTMVSLFKKSGQPKTKVYSVIEMNDMAKIKQYFDRSSPEALQNEIIFNLIYFFGFRGRETLPLLSKESINIETDSNGKRFLKINHDILSKNSKGSLKSDEYEDLKQGRAYEDKEHPQKCPVVAWELYLSKTSASNFLFPKPCKLVSKKKTTNFCEGVKLGKNYLDNFMKKLSHLLSLSKQYTNHCIRVTLVTTLKESGFSNTDISTITGHRNPQSVDRYNRKRRDEDFEQLSQAAHLGFSGQIVSVKKVSKTSRIVVASSSSVNSADDMSGGLTNVYFNGTFNNCEIKIIK